MKHEILPLWRKEEYTYDTGVDFMPTLTTYILDGVNVKDAVLVAPGGGYCNISPCEAEGVAMKFLQAGMNVFVITYTVRMRLSMALLYKQPLRDISMAMIMIRENAKKWRVNEKHIAVCGFSAGGHLAASLSTLWNDENLKDIRGIDQFSNRPDASILAYPVITAGEFKHKGSFNNLVGENAGETEMQEMSLELCVSSETPPAFLWHTFADASVPVENSMLYASALRKYNIPFELHIFPTEGHGTSTSDQQWALQGTDILSSPVCQLKVLLAKKEIEGQGKAADEKALLTYFESEYAVKRDISAPGFAHNANWVKLCVEWLQNLFQ